MKNKHELNLRQIEYLETEMKNEIRVNTNSIENLTNAFNQLVKEGINTNREQFNHVIKLTNYFLKDIRQTKRWFLHHINNPEKI